MEPPEPSDSARPSQSLTLVSLLTLFALAVHGFHPNAEDGGVYLPAVKRLLAPGLYGPNPAFVLAPTRISIFAPCVAGLVRFTHISLPWFLLILYAASVWLMLYAAWLIAARCTSSRSGQAGAVALLACWLTLPIAGTSLLLMDPYVTARSFSSPLILFAVASTLPSQSRLTFLPIPTLALAALFHPLMAGYGAAGVLCILVMQLAETRHRVTAAILLIVAAIALASAVQALPAPESPAYKEAILTRYYWFPMSWHWYEQLGSLAPLLILSTSARRGFGRSQQAVQILSKAAILLGLIALLVALIFARSGLSNHLVARLQPLRALQLVYVTMILLVGARIGESLLRTNIPQWSLFFAIAASPMLLAERQTYPASNHFEAPWIIPRNPWQRAFLWARDHTPQNARFALDARYITQGRNEDAQAFRATAERDALPDYSKDGGEAAIAPELAAAWKQGVEAQTGLDQKSDPQRQAILKPFGVVWIILDTRSPTAWLCPYSNNIVKVCSLP